MNKDGLTIQTHVRNYPLSWSLINLRQIPIGVSVRYFQFFIDNCKILSLRGGFFASFRLFSKKCH